MSSDNFGCRINGGHNRDRGNQGLWVLLRSWNGDEQTSAYAQGLLVPSPKVVVVSRTAKDLSTIIDTLIISTRTIARNRQGVVVVSSEGAPPAANGEPCSGVSAPVLPSIV
jgi:hypothetical protein